MDALKEMKSKKSIIDKTCITLLFLCPMLAKLTPSFFNIQEKQLCEKSRECEALSSKLTSALQQKVGLEKQVTLAQAKEASLQAQIDGLKVKVEEAAKVSGP